MTIEQTLREIGARAKAASTALQLLTSDEKNAILQAMAD